MRTQFLKQIKLAYFRSLFLIWLFAAALSMVGCGTDQQQLSIDTTSKGVAQISATYGQSAIGTVDGFPFLRLRGTHYERGKAHGVLAANQIIANVNAMAAYLNGSGVLTWNDAISGLAYFSFQTRFDTELTGMIDGITEALPSAANRTVPVLGRAITLNDLKVLQVGDMLELAACSQFSAWGPLTVGGNTIVGRNWDYPPLFPTSGTAVIASDPSEAGLFSTMDAMWFGMVGNGIATVREDGLYISGNDASIDEPGLPFANPNPSALRVRELAETISLATAPTSFAAGLANHVPLALIFHVSFPVPHSQALLPTVVEYDSRTSGGFGTTLRSAQGSLPTAIVLTNHFLQSGAPTSSSSQNRYNALWNGLLAHKNAGTTVGFSQARDLLDAASQSNTLYSVVAWPAERKLMIAVSPSPGVSATDGVYKTVLWSDVFDANPVSITSQPANATVTVGQTATFTVVASGSSLTYQWQKNGVNISAATAASYTTPATVLADNGAQFRCVVTGSGGSATSNAATLIVNSTATTPTGLLGQYYADTNFTSLYHSQTDPYINFTWGSEGDNFSIRWTGQVQAAFSEAYTFSTSSDGAVRVWLNNVLIIDHYTLHNSTQNMSSAPITLVAGRRYNLRVDYYDTVNTSVIQLRWQSPSQAAQIIPTSRLYLP